MRRASIVVGSLAVHAGLAAAWLTLRPAAPIARDAPSAVSVEVVDRAPDPPAVAPAPVLPERVPGGGGAAPRRARRGAPHPHEGDLAPSDARSEVTMRIDTDAPAPSEVGRGGTGLGGGRGTGSGLGIGIGTDLGALPPPPPPPPPPAALAAPRSLARPARLIYPSRERDAEDSALFVARVTVDTDGYVVGAHLVRGPDGPRARDASDGIWRFRYDPARDDAGRPVRSVLDQKFLVQ